MDGENNGSKPYEQMDDLGVFPSFLETPIWFFHFLNGIFFLKTTIETGWCQVICKTIKCRPGGMIMIYMIDTPNHYDIPMGVSKNMVGNIPKSSICS